MDALFVIFWGSALLLLYLHAGYPLVMWWIARVRPKPVRREALTPRVSIIVAAHDEEKTIGRRIRNLLRLEYPNRRLEILVGSDGSTDRTVERARRTGQSRVRVFSFSERRGKAAVLNALVARATGDVLVFADARQIFATTALKELVASFADPEVGAVGGELILTHGEDPSSVGNGVGFYWKYEKFIRKQESRVDSTLGASGAIYAVRRRLFEPIPQDTLLDDVWVPMQVVRKGYRTVFEPRARAFDRVSETAAQEFTRKVRTLTGNFQLLARELWMLDPLHNRVCFQILSHKVLRLLAPALFALFLLSNVALATTPPLLAVLLAQLAFYTAALGGRLLERGRIASLLAAPYAVCLLNLATVIAFAGWIHGGQRGTWEKATPPLPLHVARSGDRQAS